MGRAGESWVAEVRSAASSATATALAISSRDQLYLVSRAEAEAGAIQALHYAGHNNRPSSWRAPGEHSHIHTSLQSKIKQMKYGGLYVIKENRIK